MHFAIFVVYLANVLANRACSLRHFYCNISCLRIILYQILLLVELLLMIYCKVVPGATTYKITRFISILIIGILSFNTTQISTFCATFLARYS